MANNIQSFAGRVGIDLGTATPSDDLHVGNDIRLGLTTDTGSVFRIKSNGGLSLYGSENQSVSGQTTSILSGQGTGQCSILLQPGTSISNIRLNTGNVTRLKVFNNGNIGIGTDSTNYKLDVNGTVNVGALTATTGTYSGTLGVGGATTLGTLSASSGTYSSIITINDAIDASEATGTSGALRVKGGVSIAKKLYVGLETILKDLSATNGTYSGTLGVSGATTLGTLSATTLGVSGATTIGTLSASSGTFTGDMDINSTIDATGINNNIGALQVAGGATISKKLYVGTGLYISDFIYHIGNTTTKFGFNGDNAFIIDTAGVTRLAISSGGTVDVGALNATTGTFSGNITVSSSNYSSSIGLSSDDLNILEIKSLGDVNRYGIMNLYVGSGVDNTSIVGLSIASGGNVNLHNKLTTGGNIGIGKTSAAIALDVGDALSNPVIGRYLTGSPHDADKRDTVHIGRSDNGDFLGIKCRVDTHTELGIETESGSLGTVDANQTEIGFFTWGNNIYSSRQVMTINSYGKVGIGPGSTRPTSVLTVNTPVATNSYYDQSTCPLALNYNVIPTSTTTLNDPKSILHLSRIGQTGQTYGVRASFKLSRYENSGSSSRSRLDLFMSHTDYKDEVSVMTFRSSKHVGFGKTNPTLNIDVGEFLSHPYIGRALSGSVHDANKRDSVHFGRTDDNLSEFLGMRCRVDTSTALNYGPNSNQTEIGFYTWGNSIANSRQVLGINAYGNASLIGVLTQSSSGFSSDDRIKYNEEDIPNNLNLILKLKPQKYEKIVSIAVSEQRGTWIPTDAEWENVKDKYTYINEIGFIAQDVRNIPELAFLVDGKETRIDTESISLEEYSNLVTEEQNIYTISYTYESNIITQEEYSNLIPEKQESCTTEYIKYIETETPLSLNYNCLFVLAVGAIQELSKALDEEKSKVSSILSRLEALENA